MKTHSVRGKILEFLKHTYPAGADERSIISVFYQYHKHSEILASLEYLADKEYIERKDIPHPYLKAEFVKVYKCAPKGIDLIEGFISDPAVLILPEES